MKKKFDWSELGGRFNMNNPSMTRDNQLLILLGVGWKTDTKSCSLPQLACNTYSAAL